ncbi:MAG: hypothetical protein IJX99_04725 [Clostridia bacterium]|nr:hypothetical protein [Clostridia bacterium]
MDEVESIFNQIRENGVIPETLTPEARQYFAKRLRKDQTYNLVGVRFIPPEQFEEEKYGHRFLKLSSRQSGYDSLYYYDSRFCRRF